MKKKKRVKSKHSEAKPHLSVPPKHVQKEEPGTIASPFGGMNMENFKKNLGCGS